VVDAAMVDGSAILMTMMWGFKAMGWWEPERGTNVLDTGAWYYDTYECADGRFISLGSLEAQFFQALLRTTGLDAADDVPHPMDKSRWPEMKERLAGIILTKTRDEWCQIMEGEDVCFAPVLAMDEAPAHPHNAARQTFVEVEGITQPAPAPRFSRTAPEIQRPPSHPGQHTDDVLADFGFDESEIAKLREAGAVA
jgi:alpha-methylacyl-CoA racemase